MKCKILSLTNEIAFNSEQKKDIIKYLFVLFILRKMRHENAPNLLKHSQRAFVLRVKCQKLQDTELTKLS